MFSLLHKMRARRSLTRTRTAAALLKRFASAESSRLLGDSLIDKDDSSKKSVEMQSLSILKLPHQYLRRSDSLNYDVITYQRNDVEYNSHDGRPTLINRTMETKEDLKYQIRSASLKDGDYTIQWKDGHSSTFAKDWVDMHLSRLGYIKDVCSQGLEEDNTSKVVVPRIPWCDLTQESLCTNQKYRMSFNFDDIVSTEEEEQTLKDAVQSLYQYGLLLVTSTPTDDEGAGIAALASALSGPAHKLSPSTSLLTAYQQSQQEEQHEHENQIILEQGTDGPQRTLYGSIWSTHSSAMADHVSTADSAYTNYALPLHTDMTYHRDPPGLQIFTMASPAIEGGESIFADGLGVAEYMRQHHPEEFEILASTPRRFHSIDPVTGWYLEGKGPVISALDRWEGWGGRPLKDEESSTNGVAQDRYGPIVQIRHNDLDRLPDVPPRYILQQGKAEVEKFYKDLERAHEIWDGLLGQDKFRLVVKLQPGETVVVANQVRRLIYRLS